MKKRTIAIEVEKALIVANAMIKRASWVDGMGSRERCEHCLGWSDMNMRKEDHDTDCPVQISYRIKEETQG